MLALQARSKRLQPKQRLWFAEWVSLPYLFLLMFPGNVGRCPFASLCPSTWQQMCTAGTEQQCTLTEPSRTKNACERQMLFGLMRKASVVMSAVSKWWNSLCISSCRLKCLKQNPPFIWLSRAVSHFLFFLSQPLRPVKISDPKALSNPKHPCNW